MKTHEIEISCKQFRSPCVYYLIGRGDQLLYVGCGKNFSRPFRHDDRGMKSRHTAYCLATKVKIFTFESIGEAKAFEQRSIIDLRPVYNKHFKKLAIPNIDENGFKYEHETVNPYANR